MDLLTRIFLFSPDEPLFFTRLYFWGFFAVVFAIYCFAYRRPGLRNAYLLLASLFFYYKTSGFFFLILVFSIVVDYLIGLSLERFRSPRTRKSLVALSVLVNLAVLSYFKYSAFLIQNLNSLIGTDFQAHNHFALLTNAVTGSHFEVSSILVPVGISFFTFQTISYSVDVYRGKVRAVRNILDFGFYVSFFPQLVSGPIVRASEFIPQLHRTYNLSREEFGLAWFWILKGLIKKVFIADYIAVNFVDRVFGDPGSYTGLENLLALYGYSLQVYADFSGYTDIALGIALLFGFRLPTNFNSPYKAVDLIDFWRRWHISLSSWLKDYLYIPLGGNRKGRVRTHINIMITMLLGGLWHGASWQFMIWGGLNGIGVLANKYWSRISPWRNSRSRIAYLVSVLLTFNFIALTRIFFRSESLDTVGDMFSRILYASSWANFGAIVSSYRMILLTMGIGFAVHWLPVRVKDGYRRWFIVTPTWLKVVIAVLTVVFLYQVASTELRPFVYFQF